MGDMKAIFIRRYGGPEVLEFGECPDPVVGDGDVLIVVGPIGSAKDALRSLEGASFDGVLLDANLRGEPVGNVAAALTRSKIPFAFVTGYGRQALPESFGNSMMLTKPFTQEQLLRTAAQLVGSRLELRLHKDASGD
jgi:CheY-like chemotaxis protein